MQLDMVKVKGDEAVLKIVVRDRDAHVVVSHLENPSIHIRCPLSVVVKPSLHKFAIRVSQGVDVVFPN